MKNEKMSCSIFLIWMVSLGGSMAAMLTGCGGVGELDEGTISSDSSERVKGQIDLSVLEQNTADATYKLLAGIADRLGFGWAGGCKSEIVGDDMYRTDEGKAIIMNSNTRDCSTGGHKSDDRLRIKFDDWQLVVRDITNIKTHPVEAKLKYLDRFWAINNNDYAMVFIPEESYSIGKSLTTSVENAFSIGQAYGAIYTTSFVAGFNYFASANYGVSTSITSATSWNNTFTVGEDQTDIESLTKKISGEIKVPPRSKLRVDILVTEKKEWAEYTALTQLVGNLTLEGFLRWRDNGGNFHRQYRGSEDRPHIKATFGKPGQGMGFIADLLDQADDNHGDFDWTAAKAARPDLEQMLEKLRRMQDMGSKRVAGQMQFITTQNFDVVVNKAVPLTKAEKKNYSSSNETKIIHDTRLH